MEQDERIVVGHDLRRDDARVRPKGGLDHQLDGVRFEANVVVAEEEERRPLHHERGLVARRREAAILFQHAHEGVRSDRRHALGDVQGVAVRQYEQAQFLVVLRRQRGCSSFESRPGTGSDDDGNNGRSTRVHQLFKASWLRHIVWAPQVRYSHGPRQIIRARVAR